MSTLTIYGRQHDSGVIVGDDVSVAVFGLVHLHVGVLPGELLARIDGLESEQRKKNKKRERETDCEWQTEQKSRLSIQITELSLACLVSGRWSVSHIAAGL